MGHPGGMSHFLMFSKLRAIRYIINAYETDTVFGFSF